MTTTPVLRDSLGDLMRARTFSATRVHTPNPEDPSLTLCGGRAVLLSEYTCSGERGEYRDDQSGRPIQGCREHGTERGLHQADLTVCAGDDSRLCGRCEKSVANRLAAEAETSAPAEIPCPATQPEHLAACIAVAHDQGDHRDKHGCIWPNSDEAAAPAPEPVDQDQAPAAESSRTWVSPNGVSHTVLADGRCVTCGKGPHADDPAPTSYLIESHYADDAPTVRVVDAEGLTTWLRSNIEAEHYAGDATTLDGTWRWDGRGALTELTLMHTGTTADDDDYIHSAWSVHGPEAETRQPELTFSVRLDGRA